MDANVVADDLSISSGSWSIHNQNGSEFYHHWLSSDVDESVILPPMEFTVISDAESDAVIGQSPNSLFSNWQYNSRVLPVGSHIESGPVQLSAAGIFGGTNGRITNLADEPSPNASGNFGNNPPHPYGEGGTRSKFLRVFENDIDLFGAVDIEVSGNMPELTIKQGATYRFQVYYQIWIEPVDGVESVGIIYKRGQGWPYSAGQIALHGTANFSNPYPGTELKFGGLPLNTKFDETRYVYAITEIEGADWEAELPIYLDDTISATGSLGRFMIPVRPNANNGAGRDEMESNATLDLSREVPYLELRQDPDTSGNNFFTRFQPSDNNYRETTRDFTGVSHNWGPQGIFNGTGITDFYRFRITDSGEAFTTGFHPTRIRIQKTRQKPTLSLAVRWSYSLFEAGETLTVFFDITDVFGEGLTDCLVVVSNIFTFSGLDATVDIAAGETETITATIAITADMEAAGEVEISTIGKGERHGIQKATAPQTFTVS